MLCFYIVKWKLFPCGNNRSSQPVATRRIRFAFSYCKPPTRNPMPAFAVIAGLTRNLIKWRRRPDLLRRQETSSCYGFNCFCIDLLRLGFILVVMGLRVGFFLDLSIATKCRSKSVTVVAIYLLSLAMTTLFWHCNCASLIMFALTCCD